MLRIFCLSLRASVFRPIALCLLLAALCGGRLPARERVEAGPAAVSTDLSELSARVGKIANDRSLSRAQKANRISSVVREVLVAATSGNQDQTEVFAITMDVARVAAGAAPRFAEVIASAAALSPAGKSGGDAGRIREATYAGAHSPNQSEEKKPVARQESKPMDAAPTYPGLPEDSPVAAKRKDRRPVAAENQTGPATDKPAAVAVVIPGAEAPAPSLVQPSIDTSSLDAIAKKDDEVVKLDALVIQGKVAENSPKALLNERKTVSVSMDSISSVELKKYVSTDISSALIHIPGVSMSSSGGAKFAVIRGLAERYNPVLLDGMSLPSPDPERQSPQVDIFPTRLMEALVVYKNAEARLPGNGTGGTIDLRTKGVPDGPYTEVQFGLRFDEGYFQHTPFLTYSTAGNKDVIALGKSDRAPLSAFQDPNWADLAVRPHSPIAARQAALPPGYQFGLAYGHIFPLGQNGKELGIALNFTYNSSYSTDESLTYRYDQTAELTKKGQLLFRDAISKIESNARVALGGAAVLGLKLSPDHQFYSSVLLSQTGDDSVEVSGPDIVSSDAAIIHQLHYKQRHFLNYRLGGHHVFPAWGDFSADWVAGGTRVSQDEPDFRYTALALSYAPYSIGAPEPRPTTRYWREADENQKFARLDFKKSLNRGRLEGARFDFGASLNRIDRNYFDQSILLARSPAYSLPLNPQTFGEDLYRGTDTHTPYNPFGNADAKGKRNIDALYGMFTLPFWHEKFKWSAGVRLEHINLLTSGKSTLSNDSSSGLYKQNSKLFGVDMTGYVPGTDPIFTGLVDERKWLPSTSLTWSPRKSINVRLAAYKTVALPSSREMGPYYTFDAITDNVQHGNVGLQPSDATSYDARVEWFGKKADLLAFSVFHKTIQRPIEKGTFSDQTINLDSWVNNPGAAKLNGFELEFRKSLGFIAAPLANLTLGGNATWIKATVPTILGSEFIASGAFPPGTYPTRRLYDQPEKLANADVTWAVAPWGFSTTLSANYSGDSLYGTRLEGFNLYRDAFLQLDWTMSQKFGRSWTLRLSAKNLTDSALDYIFDPTVTTERYVYRTGKLGRTYSFSFSRTY